MMFTDDDIDEETGPHTTEAMRTLARIHNDQVRRMKLGAKERLADVNANKADEAISRRLKRT
jgi:hypothetical protein